jgi:hypothetical protein
VVEASMNQSEELVYKLWSTFSTFEENLAASISDMLLYASKGSFLDALSTTAYFLLKVEGLFTTLEAMNKLMVAAHNKGKICPLCSTCSSVRYANNRLDTVL